VQRHPPAGRGADVPEPARRRQVLLPERAGEHARPRAAAELPLIDQTTAPNQMDRASPRHVYIDAYASNVSSICSECLDYTDGTHT
jgi:hypothetical protein